MFEQYLMLCTNGKFKKSIDLTTGGCLFNKFQEQMKHLEELLKEEGV
jgi:soluble P-type ATPase